MGSCFSSCWNQAKQLRNRISQRNTVFYDTSSLIESVTPGPSRRFSSWFSFNKSKLTERVELASSEMMGRVSAGKHYNPLGHSSYRLPHEDPDDWNPANDDILNTTQGSGDDAVVAFASLPATISGRTATSDGYRPMEGVGGGNSTTAGFFSLGGGAGDNTVGVGSNRERVNSSSHSSIDLEWENEEGINAVVVISAGNKEGAAIEDRASIHSSGTANSTHNDEDDFEWEGDFASTQISAAGLDFDTEQLISEIDQMTEALREPSPVR